MTVILNKYFMYTASVNVRPFLNNLLKNRISLILGLGKKISQKSRLLPQNIIKIHRKGEIYHLSYLVFLLS